MKKKVLPILLVTGILTMPITPQLESYTPVAQTINKTIGVQETQAAVVPRWLINLTWKVAVALGLDPLGNAFVNKTASYTKNSLGEVISPGSITFNQGNYGPTSYFDFKMSNGNSVILRANSSIFLWSRKLIITLENPNRDDVVDAVVTHGQWVGYAPGMSGTYRVRFGTTEKHDWTPYIEYRYDRAGGQYQSSAVSSLSTSNSLSLTENKTTQETDGLSDDLSIIPAENYIAIKKYGNVIKPSNEHIKNKELKKEKKEYLTALDISNQFIDLKFNTNVYALKDYSAGETIKFKDKIIDIYYDEENNETAFVFKGEQSELRFANDLTKTYKKGDTLDLKFNVVKLSSDSKYLEVLDFMKYMADMDESPSIDGYLN